MDINAQFQPLIDAILNDLKQQAQQQISAAVNSTISSVDINGIIGQLVLNQLQLLTQNYNFPDGSISPTALKLSELKLSGNQISGGKVEGFSSYGIQDNSSNTVVFIDDDTVSINRPLSSKNLTVNGDTVIHGNLNVVGTINSNGVNTQEIIKSVLVELNNSQDFYNSTKQMLESDFSTAGVDVASIKMSGRTVLEGSKLGTSITESNLQKIGLLNELQVRGTADLAGTFYAIPKRIGINTPEPNFTFDMWDQEVEIIAGKKENNTAMFGTNRDCSLVITANGKENVKLLIDGTTRIIKPIVAETKMVSSDVIPSYDEPIGTIAWNTKPTVGSSIGWVSLGAARWASFGTVQ